MWYRNRRLLASQQLSSIFWINIFKPFCWLKRLLKLNFGYLVSIKHSRKKINLARFFPSRFLLSFQQFRFYQRLSSITPWSKLTIIKSIFSLGFWLTRKELCKLRVDGIAVFYTFMLMYIISKLMTNKEDYRDSTQYSSSSAKGSVPLWIKIKYF